MTRRTRRVRLHREHTSISPVRSTHIRPRIRLSGCCVSRPGLILSCLPKPSGNSQRAPVTATACGATDRRLSVLRQTAISTDLDGMAEVRTEKRWMSARSSQIHGGFTTCMEMWRRYVLTGMRKISPRRRIRLGHCTRGGSTLIPRIRHAVFPDRFSRRPESSRAAGIFSIRRRGAGPPHA